jgi:hypothetical protein
MAEYREIQGAAVQSLASNTGTIEGQIWYDNVNGAFKLEAVTTVGAWSTGGNLNTAVLLGGAFGSKTAGVYTQGFSPAIPATNATQEYDGSTWTAGTNHPTSSTGGGGGTGIQTAGMVAGGGGGSRTANAFDYNGTSWTATGSLTNAADNLGTCGTDTTTDVIIALGRIPSTGNAGNNTTNTYNGTSFASGPNINTGRLLMAGGGTQTAGWIAGGFKDPSPNAMTNTEEYNGSAWSTVNPLNTASGLNGGWGIQTSAICQVNSPGPGDRSGIERYDGTSWTTVASLPITGNGGYTTGAGSSASAGGWHTGLGPSFNGTNEWTDAGAPETRTITT